MSKREPDFDNLLRVLNRTTPARPTLFEFFLNEKLYEMLADEEAKSSSGELRKFRVLISAFKNAGYDYSTVPTSYTKTLWFSKGEVEQKSSKSLNDGFVITDVESFENYKWPDPEAGHYEIFDEIAPLFPDGMKAIPSGPGGLLENAIELVGYENLCFMCLENPDLVSAIFDALGSRLLRFYELVSSFPVVGAAIYNDDWGFKTQTMLPPEMLRQWVFPWCRKIVDAIHANGKKAIIHSCGNLSEVMDEVSGTLHFDGKHSFEDIISPVEKEWTKYHRDIAILGGIDLDFLAESTPGQVRKRALDLLKLTAGEGSYALGSGNSIPTYIPAENYLAMINAVREF